MPHKALANAARGVGKHIIGSRFESRFVQVLCVIVFRRCLPLFHYVLCAASSLEEGDLCAGLLVEEGVGEYLHNAELGHRCLHVDVLLAAIGDV